MITHWRYEEDGSEGDFSLGCEMGLGKRVTGILGEETVE